MFNETILNHHYMVIAIWFGSYFGILLFSSLSTPISLGRRVGSKLVNQYFWSRFSKVLKKLNKTFSSTGEYENCPPFQVSPSWKPRLEHLVASQ